MKKRRKKWIKSSSKLWSERNGRKRRRKMTVKSTVFLHLIIWTIAVSLYTGKWPATRTYTDSQAVAEALKLGNIRAAYRSTHTHWSSVNLLSDFHLKVKTRFYTIAVTNPFSGVTVFLVLCVSVSEPKTVCCSFVPEKKFFFSIFLLLVTGPQFTVCPFTADQCSTFQNFCKRTESSARTRIHTLPQSTSTFACQRVELFYCLRGHTLSQSNEWMMMKKK